MMVLRLGFFVLVLQQGGTLGARRRRKRKKEIRGEEEDFTGRLVILIAVFKGGVASRLVPPSFYSGRRN